MAGLQDGWILFPKPIILISHKKRSFNQAADFHSRIIHGEYGVESMDKGDKMCVVASDDVDAG